MGVTRNGVTYPVICAEWFLPSGRGFPGPLWDVEPREVAERYAHTRGIRTFLKYPGQFPVDVRHNSKIFREKLAVWADRHLGRGWIPEEYREENA